MDSPASTPRPSDFFIERLPVTNLNRHFDRWKKLTREGWVLAVLLAPDKRTIVAMGVRDAAGRGS